MKKISFLFALLCASVMMFAATDKVSMTGFGGKTGTAYQNVTVAGTSENGVAMVAYAYIPDAGQVRGNKTEAVGAEVAAADNGKNWSLYNSEAMPGAIKAIKVVSTEADGATNKFQNNLYVALGTESQGAVTAVTDALAGTLVEAKEFDFAIDANKGYTYFKILSTEKFTGGSVKGVYVEIEYEEAPAREEIVFTAATDAGAFKDTTFAITDLTLTTVDPDGKIKTTANDCRFGEADNWTMYNFRLQTVGKSNKETEPTKNYLKFNAEKDGNLIVAVRTGSNSDTTRTIVAVQGGAKIFETIVRESMKVTVPVTDSTGIDVYPYITIPVKKGEVLLTYPVNGVNFYAFAFEAVDAPALEPATWYGAEAFTTEGTVIDPAVWSAVEYNITRNADKTLSFVAEFTDAVTGLVGQINLGDGFKDMVAEGLKFTYNTTATYEDGAALEGAFFYFPYAGAAKRIDIVYTVGASNEKPATPEKPAPTASARILAYNLNVEADGDNYKFTYTANIDGTEANIVFYTEDGTEAGKVAIDAPKAGANTAVVAKADIPAGKLTWAVELKALPVAEFTNVFTSAKSYNRLHAAIDNSPESDNFGTIYMTNNGTVGKGLFIYNADYTEANEGSLITAGLTWGSPARLDVDAYGKVWISDWADGDAAGVWIFDPANPDTLTQFYDFATKTSKGQYLNAEGVELGEGNPAVGVFGEGKDMIVYVAGEEGGTTLKANGINMYQVGQADGSVLYKWGVAPTVIANSKDNANGTFSFGATSHGVFVGQNRAAPNNAAGAYAAQFYDKAGEQRWNSDKTNHPEIDGCNASALTVSWDEKKMAMIDGSKHILVYDIAWEGDVPTLTLAGKYDVDYACAATLDFDYAGNLIGTFGAAYAPASMGGKLCVYALPTDNNVTVVPAKKALTVEGTKVDMGPIDHSWFSNADWSGEETVSTATWDAVNEVVDVHIATQKSGQWQAQVFINTALAPINAVPEAGKKYSVTVKMKADKEVGGVTLKYQNNAEMLYENQSVKLLANEEYVYTKEAVDGQAGDNMFVFDFGWAAADTHIEIYDIEIKEVSETTAFDNLEGKVESRKVMIDGKIYIIRDGKTYNVMGMQVR
ncbi:MAG: hypothetical protein IJ776_01010 [Paludibacteraceae bacterium]|nr:hypothetical protein [Paludibacteraceae bacterium]